MPTTPVMAVILSQAAVSALWRGQVVEAIKLVRVEQHIGLKEAKEQVEAYVHTQPALRSRLVHAHADAREGLLRWVIFFLIGGAGLFFFLA
ncbi:MAG: hypothetical protein KF876_06955 [Nitrospira sp.]|nr:hypothetical protein [Nitrospira sp.]